MRRWSSGIQVVVAAVVLAWPNLSCSHCERTGCDSLGQTAAQGGPGLAGVVAESSDLVTNGCQECPLGNATLQLWRVDTPIETEAAAKALLAEREPDTSQDVTGHYRIAADPGHYLLCVRPSCIGVTVAAGETVTVNIKRRNGLTGFFVGASGNTPLTENFGFEVAY